MSVAEFLRQRAVQVNLSGTYSLHRWYDCEGKRRTFACRTKRISPFRMIVDVPVVGPEIRQRLCGEIRRKAAARPRPPDRPLGRAAAGLRRPDGRSAFT